ncbi:ATP phosphoribosyltransferase [Hyphococcus sp.]|uniref:ATP phosphoribosyltransferase n=1 Tax=Hyphococcus sp. TaxID=2038636 RepID=UPI0020815021|nr:MAG: ATP phosphoribosyltransferase [Marinicaulis sp.]
MSEQRLRIAIQKSGRLSDGSFDLLKNCGLTVSRGRDKLYGRVQELPIDVLLLRDDDIPAFVADDACDLGIVGQNVFEEEILNETHETPATEVLRLGFARCRLMLAAPKEWTFDGPSMLDGKRIATSYPALTRAWLEREGVGAKPIMMKGSVEVAPRLKIADAVCDIVSTGATLDANGLKPVSTVFDSEAILIRNQRAFSPEKQGVFEALMKRINGVMSSRDAKYIMMNAPRSAVGAITEFLPGADSPTVLELAGNPEKVAIHAVCRESVFWDTLEQLKKLGASAILVLPIEKMMA